MHDFGGPSQVGARSGKLGQIKSPQSGRDNLHRAWSCKGGFAAKSSARAGKQSF